MKGYQNLVGMRKCELLLRGNRVGSLRRVFSSTTGVEGNEVAGGAGVAVERTDSVAQTRYECFTGVLILLKLE